MAKDKRKKKYFQGLEHYKPEIQAGHTTEMMSEESQTTFRALKRDLNWLLVLIISFVLLLTGLTLLDKKTTILTEIAHKISSIVIK